MKTLDTLIDDIEDKLEPLCSGEHLELTDEDIDIFGEAMKKAFKQWAHPSKRNSEFSIRMSNLGKPTRQLWFEKNNPNTRSVKPFDMVKFLYGHLLEEVVLVLARLSGHDVTDEQKKVEIEGIIGTMDCKIDGEVVDVKSASNYAFKKFEQDTLSEDDPFGYITQLSTYEAAEGTDGGGFLVINKENGKLCLHRPEELEKPVVVRRIQEIKAALESDTPPEELCYAPVPEGTKGNMKLPKNCNYCPHKHKCHADANEGAGLRTFRYARGYVYLTEVAVEPKVEEVL
jgi:hypothetical protein